jgi:hypothetical protein
MDDSKVKGRMLKRLHKRIMEFCETENMQPKQLFSKARVSWALLDRVYNGGDIRTRTYESLMDFMNNYKKGKKDDKRSTEED